MMFNSLDTLHKKAQEIQLVLSNNGSSYQQANQPLATVLEFTTQGDASKSHNNNPCR